MKKDFNLLANLTEMIINMTPVPEIYIDSECAYIANPGEFCVLPHYVIGWITGFLTNRSTPVLFSTSCKGSKGFPEDDTAALKIPNEENAPQAGSLVHRKARDPMCFVQLAWLT